MSEAAARNRELVLEYFDLMFRQHSPARAAELYLSEHYAHRGPGSQGGREGFVRYFEDFFARSPDFKAEATHAIAENDLVAIHAVAREAPGAPLVHSADFYRLAEGKIVEHWDVVR